MTYYSNEILTEEFQYGHKIAQKWHIKVTYIIHI